jgi:hypothetical protein
MLVTFESERLGIIRAAQALELHPAPRTVTVKGPSTKYETWRRLFSELREELANPTGQVKPDEAALKAARELLAGELVALKATTSMYYVVRTACLNAGQGCAIEDDVVGKSFALSRTIIMPPVNRQSKWNKIETHPLKISRDSAIAEVVVSAMPKEIATSFRLADKGASLLGVTIGIMSASVESPTWTAVAEASDPTQKVPTKTKTERFRAVPAIIGSWAGSRANVNRPVHGLLEFGGALDTSRSAWFAGPGVSIGKVLRLGVGGVIARVNELDGQEEGLTVVADNNAIKTRTAWAGGWYWSVGVSLSGMPFFGK